MDKTTQPVKAHPLTRREAAATLIGAVGLSGLGACQTDGKGGYSLGSLQAELSSGATGTSILWCDTYTELRALVGGTTSTSKNVAVCRGSTAGSPYEGGGGLFVWSTTSAQDDGVTILNAGGLGTAGSGWRLPGPSYPRTAAEIAASVQPTAYNYVEGDIRRYGASTAAGFNNAAAINDALSVSAHYGSAAFIPAGNWAYTTVVTATGSSSMYGVGLASQLLPSGCDGITFAAQGAYAGARFFRDFLISGPSTTESRNNGIAITLPENTKVFGIQFSNLSIQNFAKGVYVSGAGGLRNSAFNDCWLFNDYQGYYLQGQAILLQIRGGFAQSWTMKGTGPRYGIFTGLSDEGTGNVQSLHVQGFGAYDYDILVLLDFTIEAVLENCDFSIFNKYGVQICTINGGPTVVRDCWIQAAWEAASPIGIYLVDRGAPALDKVVIDSNMLLGNEDPASIGIYCGVNQQAITLTNNTIGTSWYPFVYGIAGPSNWATAANLVALHNTIYATTTAIAVNSLMAGMTIGPNTTQHGTPLAFSHHTTPPGLQYYWNGMQGTATFASSTSVLVALPIMMPTANYFVSLGGNASGYVWVVDKTTTGFTINCSATNSNPTDWAASL